ncbi:hypothetical protein [Ornithinibacillus scapharcae]|uniref:hypothetical protein n=1 Tax=Ornithinibacillus scapharcae TaxID=1147159 RepID=UPI000225B544|nr:hypothetical protein [Ornithinibacillus scapharcae]
MKILIQNCFHWIGYHYVNYFLEKGMVVKGVDQINTNKKENLYMLVGRNSSFELMETFDPSDQVDVMLIIGKVDIPNNITCNRIIHIPIGNSPQKLPNTVVINPPILFGEWMDMNETGFYHDNHFITFDSDEFRRDAVHIHDFVQATYPVLNADVISQRIDVLSKKIFLDDAVKLENSIYIRDNRPIEESLRKIKSHYQRYQQFY